MYDAMAIAKYVIDKCTHDGVPISNLQLQKILYFIQLNFLKILDKIAFNNDIEAWQHGPVVPDVYSLYSGYGGTKIYMTDENIRKMFNSNIEKEIVDKVTILCRSLDAWELVERTHKSGTPWSHVYTGRPNEIIPVKLIREYSRGK